jgi:hypothetical protein
MLVGIFDNPHDVFFAESLGHPITWVTIYRVSGYVPWYQTTQWIAGNRIDGDTILVNPIKCFSVGVLVVYMELTVI